MKLTKTLILALVAVFALSALALAGDDKPAEKKEAVKEWKNQTHCPVMGGKIDSTVYTDIQGHRIYHCCGMCSPTVKEDPDAIFKKAAAEGIRFENIQTTCPVSGEELKNKETFTDYEGRRIYFCCAGCIPRFTEDAKATLALMDASPEEQAAKMKGCMDEGEHHEMEKDNKDSGEDK